jgi:hypothetical protein
VRESSDRHLDYFWRREACRNMGTSMFPNCKEITESVAAFRAATEYLAGTGVEGSADALTTLFSAPGNEVARDTSSTLIVCVADGTSPRTATLFATYMDAEVHSVDPLMHAHYLEPGDAQPSELRGTLAAHACTIEQWVEAICDSTEASPDLIVVVAVHSHVMLEDYVPALRARFGTARVVIVAIPCCVEQLMAPSSARHAHHTSLKPVSAITDMGIHSNDRVVRLWDLPPSTSLDPAVTPLFVTLRTAANSGSNPARFLKSDEYRQNRPVAPPVVVADTCS